MLNAKGLALRSALFFSIRSFFRNNGFLEVDTPIRQPVVIPEHNIIPIESGEWFLQSSPEQCMKRLLVLGCEKIFQICPCFRAEELGQLHLEEFTMLEWYRLDSDYLELMSDCENLVRHVVSSLAEEEEYRTAISGSCFGKLPVFEPWQRITVKEAFAQYCPCSVGQAMEQGLFDEMIVEYIEPQLGKARPTFLHDYPAECASLAKLRTDNPEVAERCELYISGLELANGFTELTDVVEQRRRFETELHEMEKMGRGRGQLPLRFLSDLQKIDRAAGIALGVDRLLMLLMSADSIHDVVPFAPGDWG